MDLSRDTVTGERNRFALKVVLGLVIAGATIGLATGFLGASAIRALGFSADDDPAPVQPAATDDADEPSDEPSPTDEPTAEPTTEPTTEPEPDGQKPRTRFQVEQDAVSAGERIDLSGRAPKLGAGETLQIQRREAASGSWSDFPVTVETRKGGRFSTWIVTGRTGTWEFRAASGDFSTPTATVTIN
ncbi:hypothetical protein CLV56_3331 [Mumia flava]|uniref:Uncharacterized protein n=1 Tax=Mumia flava TaxID=1348852 RepID=A0A2M9B7B4_9ACTN|nr:hypothetical protein [Mumia flava]PJJ53833.1 hypothetical protein CLV56_3331 [Mumia flava]